MATSPVQDTQLDLEVVIPVKNEADILESHIIKLAAHLKKQAKYSYIITIANNGSTDGTLEVAKHLAKKYPKHIRVASFSKAGRGGALKGVWGKSKAKIVAYMDADLATDLRSFNALISPILQDKADIVTGSRFHKNSQVTRSVLRKVMSVVYSKIAQKFLNIPVTDFQCGFKAMKADVAKRLLPVVSDNEWFFDTELLALAHRQNIRIKEIPILWRESPKTSVKFTSTILALLAGVNRLGSEFGKKITLERVAILFIMAVGAGIFLVNSGSNGLMNPYYTMAAQAARDNFSSFIFGSLDASNFITIDKIPLGVWASALSSFIFGFNSFGLVLPHALAGVLSIYILYRIVKADFGVISGLTAALVFLFMPVSSVVFRFNNPDSLLVFFLLLATASFQYVMKNYRSVIPYIICGASFGFAFQAKTLQALIILPACLAAFILWNKGQFLSIRKRNVFFGAATFLIVALWWPFMMTVIPTHVRPIIGGTQHNSVWELITGYNGVARITGNDIANTGSAFGGEPGILRMLNASFGVNIGLVLVFAVAVMCIAAWRYKIFSRAPTEQRSIQFIFWSMWLIFFVGIFSFMKGTIHPYYVVVLVPPVAAFFGIATRLIRSDDTSADRTLFTRFLICLSASVSVWYVLPQILNKFPLWHKGLITILVILALGLSLFCLILLTTKKHPSISLVVFGMLLIFVMPLVSVKETIGSTYVGYLPTAHPEAADRAKIAQFSSPSPSFLQNLETKRHDAQWVAATLNSFDAAPIQIRTKMPVMVLGGFAGKNNTITVQTLKEYIAKGHVRYFVQKGGRVAGDVGCDQNRLQIDSLCGPVEESSKSILDVEKWIKQNSQLCSSDSEWFLYDMSGKDCR